MKQIKTERIKGLISVTASAICAFVTGCSTLGPNPTKYDAIMFAPLAADQARVCFVRQSSLQGALVTHYVFDCGTNIKFDSTLIEKPQVVPSATNGYGIIEAQKTMPSNDYKMWWACIALPEHVQPEDAIAFHYLPGDENNMVYYISGGKIFGQQLRLGFNLIPGREMISGEKLIRDLASKIARNARYIGSIRSGGTLVFDRPQGILRLKVVLENGSEAFAPDFAIEKGKRYTVVQSWGIFGVKFTISERP